jgi:hypothetical protein
LSVQQDQEDALSELILSVEKILSCKVSASPVASIYEVESDEPKVLAILQDMFSEDRPAPAGAKPVEKISKPGKKEKNGIIHRAYHTRKDVRYEVLNSPNADLIGQEFLTGPLTMKLKAGKIPEGTSLRHPTKGIFVVEKMVGGVLWLAPVIEGSNVVLDAQP